MKRSYHLRVIEDVTAFDVYLDAHLDPVLEMSWFERGAIVIVETSVPLPYVSSSREVYSGHVFILPNGLAGFRGMRSGNELERTMPLERKKQR